MVWIFAPCLQWWSSGQRSSLIFLIFLYSTFRNCLMLWDKICVTVTMRWQMAQSTVRLFSMIMSESCHKHTAAITPWAFCPSSCPGILSFKKNQNLCEFQIGSEIFSQAFDSFDSFEWIMNVVYLFFCLAQRNVVSFFVWLDESYMIIKDVSWARDRIRDAERQKQWWWVHGDDQPSPKRKYFIASKRN